MIFFEDLVLLLGGEDLEGLDQGQSCIDHGCQLPGKDGDTSAVSPSFSKAGKYWISFPFAAIFVGMIFCCRRWMRMAASFGASISPFLIDPFSVFPSHLKIGIIHFPSSPILRIKRSGEVGLSFSPPAHDVRMWISICRNSSRLWLRSMAVFEGRSGDAPQGREGPGSSSAFRISPGPPASGNRSAGSYPLGSGFGWQGSES